MSREILFKGKHIHALPGNEHLNGRWIEGYLSDENHINSPELAGEFQIDPETVCQYIGLTDSTSWEQLSENERENFLAKWNYKEERQNTKEDWNGRKIFEGDIIAFTDTYSTDSGRAEGNCIGKVVWDEEELCFYVTERLSAESWEVLQECYVIGNIFDDSEIL